MSTDFINFQNQINYIKYVMDYYFTMLVVPIGALLNIISALIFRRKNLNKTSMGFFYFWTSVLNAFSLTFYLFFFNSNLFFHYDLSTISDASCKASITIKRAIRSLVPWLTILFTVERFVCLKFKNKSFQWKKQTYLWILLAVLVGLFIVNSVNLYFYVDYRNTTLTESYNQTRLIITASCTASHYVLFMADFIAATFRIAIPLICVIVLDLMIISKLVMNIKFFSKTDKKSIRQHKRENHFTFTVIMVDVFFIIFNLPVGVCYVVRNMYTGIGAQNSYILAVLDFIWLKTHDTANLYHALFFFINFVFNSLFRREIFLIIIQLYFKIKAKFV